MHPLLWPILILALGIGLIVLEMLIPSGGILSFMAAVAIIASVVVAFFNGGPTVGTLFLMVNAILVPAFIVGAVRVWPYTPMGRSIIRTPPQSDDEFLPDDDHLKLLIGQHGRAKTVMLPAGAIIINNRAFDAVSSGMPIEEGQIVEVIKVAGSRIVVRPYDGEENFDDPADGDDILSQPFEKFGLDDPLA